jgi:hypothetical protein
MNFRVTADDGRTLLLRFSNKVISENGYLEFLSGVETAASNTWAFGLATLANQAVVIASRHQLSSDKSSAYLRCMDACDDIEFELFKLLCYTARD